MRLQGSRFFYLIPFLVLVLSQIVCNMPMSEEETLDLAEDFLGLEVGEGLDYEVEVIPIPLDEHSDTQRDWCYEYIPFGSYPIESFEFGQQNEWGTLSVISIGGRLVYTQDPNEDYKYCRNVYPSGVDCITLLNPMTYERSLDISLPGDDPDYEKHVNCYHAIHNLTLIEPEMPDGAVSQDESHQTEEQSQAEDTVDENQADLFSLDDCSCGGVNVPLKVDSSSASNNTFKMSITSEVQVDVTGHLTCDWQDVHQSENKTGTIRIYLNVYKFDSAQDAQTLFTKLRNEITLKPPYCEAEPDRCTVASADFGEDRAFYAWKNIYVGGKGELPSDHGAIMARLITTSEKYYVLELSVTHPELEMGDNWVIDTSQAVEACVVSITNR